MKKFLILSLLLAGCSSQEVQPGGDQATAPAPISRDAAAAAFRIAVLTGLYEGGRPEQPDQMCVVDGKGAMRFGLVVWGGNMHSCSGSGTITRTGDRLRLAMAGDSACTLEARVSGDRIVFPAAIPEGCAYYCGARASLRGITLRQTGTRAADAMKARDLVGEPLCGGEEG